MVILVDEHFIKLLNVKLTISRKNVRFRDIFSFAQKTMKRNCILIFYWIALHIQKNEDDYVHECARS